MTPGLTPSRSLEWVALSFLMLSVSALFAVYYPPISGVEDEIGFVNQALVWSRGAVTAERAGWPGLIEFEPARPGGPRVGTRHPGRSLLALPFVLLGGTRSVFLSGLLIHLVTTAVAALLLARLGRSPLWGVLVLFHPTLALFSRTVMADEAAGLGILLAALAFTFRSRWGAIAAGLAVGLAASMRYHAGLALPIVAAAYLVPSGRPKGWRDAALCLLAGGGAGGLIVAYNIAIYGSPTDPFTSRRGFFSAQFLIPHATFYAAALLTIWPLMLLAPAFDRSPLRWLVRGCCGLFLSALCVYYFHDQRPSVVETLVLGQRLLQVALPLWIVSYAGVADDWLAAPLRRRFGERIGKGVVIVGCLGLLAANGVAFARHQRHLNELVAARDELVKHVPEGSLILHAGSAYKLVAVPTEVPVYRLRCLELFGQPAEDPAVLFRDLRREVPPWYIAALHRSPGAPLSDYAQSVIDRYEMERVPTRSRLLSLYLHGSSPRRARIPTEGNAIEGR